MPLVTKRRMRAVYAMLLDFAPFSRWSLPDPDGVRFELLAGEDHAEVDVYSARPVIRVNADTNLTLVQLVEAIAHEMAHIRQHALGRLPENPGLHHNAEFRRLARLICRDLGFDVQRF
jgi:hypothetical protein